MLHLPAGSLTAKSIALLAVLAAASVALGVPSLLPPDGSAGGAPAAGPVPHAPPPPPASPPPGGSGGVPGPSPPAQSPTPALNGSPFLQVDGAGGGFATDDNLLPEEYANPNGSAWVDSYVLQTTPTVHNDRAIVKVAEEGNYSTAIDSVALGLVAPGAQSLYTQEGSSTILGVSGSLAVVAAHDGNGNNVTPLLNDPAANGSTPSGTYYQGSSGDVVVAGFGSIAGASQDVLLLRAAQDPGFPPSGPSGISVSVQNPNTGVFSTVGLLAPREFFGTESIPLSSVLPTGTQPVVVRLVWQGSHDLAWLALGTGVSAVSPAPSTLVSAISGQGWNWTSLLAYTDGVDAYFLPGDNATLTFGLPFAPPAGSSYVVITDGAPWTTPSGSPQAAFVYQPSVPVTNRTVAFTSTSWDNSSALVAFNWSFGDGTWGSGSSVGHAYANPGWYNVTLNVTDSAGYSSSVTHPVLVYPLWDWQSPQPAWNSGNLCTVQIHGNQETCKNTRSNQCSPALQYNFSANATSIALSLTGGRDCAALNFLGYHDSIYLNVTGSDWTYLDLAIAGSDNRFSVDLTGSNDPITSVLYGRMDNYTLTSSGSQNTLRTILVSVDLPADAAPSGQGSHTDEVALSASGSNNAQNISWVSFPGPNTPFHSTGMPGSGRQNTVNWGNTSMFVASWASPLNTSCLGPDHGGCCSQGWGGHHQCCGWDPAGGGDQNCCGWGQGGGGHHCCWWGQGGGGDHCCWNENGAAPDHGCGWTVHAPEVVPQGGAHPSPRGLPAFASPGFPVASGVGRIARTTDLFAA